MEIAKDTATAFSVLETITKPSESKKMRNDDGFFKGYSREEFNDRKTWYEEKYEEHVRHHLISRGDDETVHLLEEMKFAYSHGLFASTVFLSAAIVEQVVHEVFFETDVLAEEHENRLTLGMLSSRYEEEANRFLTDEIDDIIELHHDRVGIYHYKRPFSGEAPAMKEWAESGEWDFGRERFKDQAEHGVMTAFRIVGVNWRKRVEQ